MSLFRLDASIRTDRSASREIADIVEQEWLANHPGDDVVRRHVGVEPVPSDAWAHAVAAGMTPEADRTPQQREAVRLAAELTDELLGADAVLLAGTPTVLATVRGGAYGAGTPREGWDHSTGYLRRILGDVWGADLTVVEREFTLVGVNPALDEFTDLAARLHEESRQAAVLAGKALGAEVAA